jgi:hypothetical protein
MFPEYVSKQLAREKESEHAVVEEKEILLPDPSALLIRHSSLYLLKDCGYR